MTVQIALLRGINVGGHRPVAMSDLRDLVTGLGFDSARSMLQSGNLVFRGQTGERLERLLEAEANTRLGLHADFLIRSAKEWKEVVARNPFRKEAEHDPSHLVVMFLKAAPNAKDVKAVQRSAGAVAIGPVLQGLRRPINDLSRGATVQDIVNTVAITAIQAQDSDG